MWPSVHFEWTGATITTDCLDSMKWMKEWNCISKWGTNPKDKSKDHSDWQSPTFDILSTQSMSGNKSSLQQPRGQYTLYKIANFTLTFMRISSKV